MFVLEICGNTDGRSNINGHESQHFVYSNHYFLMPCLLTSYQHGTAIGGIYIYVFLHSGLDKKYTLSYISFALAHTNLKYQCYHNNTTVGHLCQNGIRAKYLVCL
jgi:hypothetical protein